MNPARLQSTQSNRKINTVYLVGSPSCWVPLVTPFSSNSREATTIRNKHGKTCFLFSGRMLLKVLIYPFSTAFNVIFKNYQWTPAWGCKCSTPWRKMLLNQTMQPSPPCTSHPVSGAGAGVQRFALEKGCLLQLHQRPGQPANRDSELVLHLCLGATAEESRAICITFQQ